jgi:hypothetical protein
MSIDVDMKSYAGENHDSAAENQTVDTNSYSQGAEEYPVNLEPNEEQQASQPPPEQPNTNPQSEHFRALREEVDRIKAEREAEKREHQLQLDLLRANMVPQQQQQPRQPQERKFLDGMKEDDIPNVGELRREWDQKESMYQARLEELQFAQSHPDYAEVLDKYLAPLVKQKPHLARGIQQSDHPSLMAYELGKMYQQTQERQVATTVSENAQRIVENAKKPGTLSQAGGQSALSQADYYASMSDREFMKFAGKNLEGI